MSSVSSRHYDAGYRNWLRVLCMAPTPVGAIFLLRIYAILRNGGDGLDRRRCLCRTQRRVAGFDGGGPFGLRNHTDVIENLLLDHS